MDYLLIVLLKTSDASDYFSFKSLTVSFLEINTEWVSGLVTIGKHLNVMDLRKYST